MQKTLWIHKLWICSYGQILIVKLLINCKNSVIYSKMAVNYEEKSFMELAPDGEIIFHHLANNNSSNLPKNYKKLAKSIKKFAKQLNKASKVCLRFSKVCPNG